MSPEQRQISFGLVGSGWRATTFLQVAHQLPERFRVTAIASRDPVKGRHFERRWHVRTVRTIAELADQDRPEFVVVSVARAAAPGVIRDIVHRDLAVLTETPPADDVPTLLALIKLVQQGARIQVAEQYHLQPLLQVQLGVAGNGLLGRVSSARISVAHDYHGISLLRRALGITFDSPTVTAREFDSPLIAGPDRSGDPVDERTVVSRQVTAHLDFGDQLGIYDFADDQYRSWIRSRELLIRGDRGEIRGNRVRYLADVRSPMVEDIRRIVAGENGNLEGLFLRGLTLGDRWLYRNPFLPGRLNDDEIAVASCLVGMSTYVGGGADLYSLAEAAQDVYLTLMIREAIATGLPVVTRPQGWG